MGSVTLPGTGAKVFTDLVGDEQVQIVKLDIGGTGVSSPVTSANPIPVSIGTLAKATDTPFSNGDPGVLLLAKRRDSDSTSVSADGDYTTLNMDEAGRLKVSTQPGNTAAVYTLANGWINDFYAGAGPSDPQYGYYGAAGQAVIFGQAAGVVLDVEILLAVRGVAVEHAFAHGQHFLLELFQIARLAQDFDADRFEARAEFGVTGAETGACQCLMFPDPGLVQLVITEGFDFAHHHAGVAVGA